MALGKIADPASTKALLKLEPKPELRQAHLDALIASTERGIYVANTWYLRMVSNMEGTITGMTRDGVFAIENGKLTKPLNNMRWHENPFRVFSEVDAMSKQLQLLGLSRWASSANAGLTAVPAMRIPAFHFSSQTRF